MRYIRRENGAERYKFVGNRPFKSNCTCGWSKHNLVSGQSQAQGAHLTTSDKYLSYLSPRGWCMLPPCAYRVVISGAAAFKAERSTKVRDIEGSGDI
eukprot:3682055-Pleurochrysis_carterae.AAC.2